MKPPGSRTTMPNHGRYQVHDPAQLDQAIRSLPLLDGLPVENAVAILAASSSLLALPAGYRIFDQGDDARHLYFTLEGEFRQVREIRPDARSAPVATLDRTLGAGHLLGRYELLYNRQHTSRVQTLTPCSLLQFEMRALEQLLYRFPGLRAHLVRQDVVNRLRTIPLLAGVDLITLIYLADEVQVHEFPQDRVIFTHKDPATTLYLIDRGQIALNAPRRPDDRTWLGAGTACGFAGGNFPGGGTGRYDQWAITAAQTRLYALPWDSLHHLGRLYPRVYDVAGQTQPLEILEALPTFRPFTPQQLRRLAGFCNYVYLPQPHMIMYQGEIGDSLWVLPQGSRATLSALDEVGHALPPVTIEGLIYFNEAALLYQSHVESTVEAHPGSVWIRLHHRDFQRFLEEEEADLREELRSQAGMPRSELPLHEAQDYPWLGEGEAVVMFQRRHWLIVLRKLLPALFAGSLAGLVVVIVELLLRNSAWAMGFTVVEVALGLVFLLLLLWGLVDYWNDYFLVTNQRVIQQEKVVFISEQRHMASLEQIQSVDVEQSLLGNLLGYGRLTIGTAAAQGSIRFDLVPNPRHVQKIVFRERNLRQQRYRAESKIDIQTALQERLGLVVDLPSRALFPRGASDPARSRPRSWRQRLFQFLQVETQLNWQQAQTIVWHKHWFVLVLRALVPLLVILAGMGLMLAGFLGGWFWGFDRGASLYLGIIGIELPAAALVLIALFWLAWIFEDWRNDAYILTHDRIVDTEKKPLFFAEQRLEAQLGDIQDIQFEIPDPLHALLDYGNVRIQTAGSLGVFTFDQVPNPRGVADEIRRRIEEWRREDERRKARERARELPDWFEMYNRLEPGQTPFQK